MSFRSYSSIVQNEIEDEYFPSFIRPLIKYDLFGTQERVKIPYPWKLHGNNFVKHRYTKEMLRLTDELFIAEDLNGRYKKNILNNTILKKKDEYELEYELEYQRQ